MVPRAPSNPRPLSVYCDMMTSECSGAQPMLRHDLARRVATAPALATVQVEEALVAACGDCTVCSAGGTDVAEDALYREGSIATTVAALVHFEAFDELEVLRDEVGTCEGCCDHESLHGGRKGCECGETDFAHATGSTVPDRGGVPSTRRRT